MPGRKDIVEMWMGWPSMRDQLARALTPLVTSRNRPPGKLAAQALARRPRNPDDAGRAETARPDARRNGKAENDVGL